MCDCTNASTQQMLYLHQSTEKELCYSLHAKKKIRSAGRGQVSSSCPELLIQKALMVIFSDMLRYEDISEAPAGAELLQLVDNLDRLAGI